jgi:hypothetical protein
VNKFPWIFVAILASVTMLVHIPPAAGGDSAYLKVTTDRTEADTYGYFAVNVESKVWQVNQTTGNTTLVPNNATVDIVLFDMDDNVTVGRLDFLQLVNGTASVSFSVQPTWTDAMIKITATEHGTGMSSSTYIQTRMSDEYMIWLIDQKWFKTFQEYSADLTASFRASDQFKTSAMVAFSFTWALLWLIVFLRLEHRVARSQNHDSLWDRFVNRYLRISFAETDEDAWLDPETTWDRGAADFYMASRKAAAARNIDGEIERLQEEKMRVTGGQLGA